MYQNIIHSRFSGILRLYQVRLLGLELHRAPNELVYGRKDHQGRSLPSHVRRRPRTESRGIHQATAHAVRRDPAGKSQTGRIPDHEHQPVQTAAALLPYLPSWKGDPRSGRGASV